MKFRRGYHFMLLWITLAVTAVCVFMFPHVNVNSDMTKYLPDSSRMKAGLKVMQEEFGRAEMNGADVRIMFEDLDAESKREFPERLAVRPEVNGIVACRTTDDGHYTLFELDVPQSVDQKALGRAIVADFGSKAIVETGQDGNTPPLYVIIIAAVLIVIILVLMSGSWLDPLLILISAGMAIAINIGTNALLPSVSITTNYIGAILQLVLSLDFSIVLLNRYRQEKSADSSGSGIRGGISSVDAVNAAIPKAFPSIFSSALTTVVGLLMLVFMKLKIGADMGIVLAKGVICSLICTFTALPSVIIILHRLIENTDKKGFVIRTDRLAGFCLRHKLPLSAFFVILFASSYYFHSKTEITFSTKGESHIDDIFPRTNTAVLLYSNEDEHSIMTLADSVLSCDGITRFISYPTMLQKRYTAEQMLDAIKALGAEMDSNSPEIIDMGMLSPEVLRLVFYMKHAPDGQMMLGFPALAEFITGHCLNSPLLGDRIDEGMRAKVAMLGDLLGNPSSEEDEPAPQDEPAVTVVTNQNTVVETEPSVTKEPKADTPPVEPKVVPKVAAPVEKVDDNVSIVDFMPKLYACRPNFNTEVMKTFADTSIMHQKLTIKQMSAVIGSTESQTRMVYSLRKSKSSLMTPLEYTHFLSDDLFHRKVVASMVKEEEKQGLRLRMRVMDLAAANAKLPVQEIISLVEAFGETGITENIVREIAFGPAPEPAHIDTDVVIADATVPDNTAVTDSTAVQPTVQPAAPAPVKRHRKTQEEVRAELISEMLYSGKTYTAQQMTRNISVLGEKLDAELMDMVYMYYGSVNNYDDAWTMTIEEFMTFLTDVILVDSRFEGFLDASVRDGIADAQEKMDEGMGMFRGDAHSIAVIIMDLPDESAETYVAIDNIQEISDSMLGSDHYLIGESVMFNEMRHGFSKEMNLITWLTVVAILLIIIISFRSLISPIILVMTVMTAVFVNVIFSGIFNGSMLYLAYLITQSILMGATIDYGILFTNYYREKRKIMAVEDAIREAYKGSIHTISTSGLIMIVATGVMAVLVNDATISAIVGSISIGATVAVALILTVLTGLLVAIDKYVRL